LQHNSPFIRANAAEMLAFRLSTNDALIDHLKAAAMDPANKEARLMGTISVAHYIIGCLLRTGLPAAHQLASSLIEKWDSPYKHDRKDLLRYLKGEGLI
jgi:hypothetical protein